uniref:Reverse transcriptase domain-containing protein n=1 Tax=Tanacetum cinerariifolium TaxID=118510 RepID=A0A699I8V8_TANCI|nr:hypothetical protein [Tanacetum cinerariifolium]
MAISVLLISSDSSKESVGTSTARVILFGIIPTSILATVPMVDPPVVHDDTLLIPTETPTISPFVSTLPHTSPFLYIDSFDSDTSERPPSYDPYEVTVARWRGRVAARSSPPSSPTHDSPPNLHKILPAPPGLPRRPTILVLSGQPIPVGRPYGTQLNGSHSSSDNFSPDDFSSDTSSDSSSGYSADTSSGRSIPDSSFDLQAASFARPSRKRRRSPTISVTLATPVPRALYVIRANLLLHCKRIRGFVSATDYEVSSKESYEPYTEPDIDFDVYANIDACITADDATEARETDVRVEVGIETDDEAEEEAESSARGTIEIGMDRVIEPVVADDVAESTKEDFPDLVSADGSKEFMQIGLDVVITMPTATRTGITPVVIEEIIERRNGALTWWNSHKRTIRTDVAYAMTWRAMMKLMTKNNDLTAYTQRIQELVLLCTKMVPKEEDQVKKFIRGLPDNIQGNVIATEPTRLRDAVSIANNLMD